MTNKKIPIETKVIKSQDQEDLISQVIELQKSGFELLGVQQYNFYIGVMFRESPQPPFISFETKELIASIIYKLIWKNIQAIKYEVDQCIDKGFSEDLNAATDSTR